MSNMRSRMIRMLRPVLRDRPAVRGALRRADEQLAIWKHSAAERFPAIIKPAPRQITLAITADCNLRCKACKYGRDFMTGESLSLEKVCEILDDARAAGVNTARFYGGEPMLHRDLPEMMAYATALGLDAYVTSNGTLLGRRVDELVEAGMRWMTIGFYGVGADYAEYTQRTGQFEKLRAGLEIARERYADRLEIQLNYVMTRQSSNRRAFHNAWDFAREFDLYFNVDPISETIPFFADPDPDLLPTEEQVRELELVSKELIERKRAHPDMMPQSEATLRALPDLLLDRRKVDVPCDAYELLWVGADGTVQLCDVCFELGNVHEKPLREMLFNETHKKACIDAFRLDCPTCACKIDSRIRKHAGSLRRYGPGASPRTAAS